MVVGSALCRTRFARTPLLAPEGCSVSLTGCSVKCSNSTSGEAFLSEDNVMSLEEVKNRQNTARNNSQPTIETLGDLGCNILPLEQRTCPPNRNGCCSPLSGSKIPGGKRTKATSGEEALPSPVRSLTVEFNKLHLQNLGSGPSKTPNKSMNTRDENILTSGADAMDSDASEPPAANGLGNSQARTDSREMSSGIATMCLDPHSPRHEARHSCTAASSEPTEVPALEEPVWRLFLFGYELGVHAGRRCRVGMRLDDTEWGSEWV